MTHDDINLMMEAMLMEESRENAPLFDADIDNDLDDYYLGGALENAPNPVVDDLNEELLSPESRIAIPELWQDILMPDAESYKPRDF